MCGQNASSFPLRGNADIDIGVTSHSHMHVSAATHVLKIDFGATVRETHCARCVDPWYCTTKVLPKPTPLALRLCAIQCFFLLHHQSTIQYLIRSFPQKRLHSHFLPHLPHAPFAEAVRRPTCHMHSRPSCRVRRVKPRVGFETHTLYFSPSPSRFLTVDQWEARTGL